MGTVLDIKNEKTEMPRITHHMTDTPLYRVWSRMKSRCRGDKHPTNNRYYRDKGITYTSRWELFENFYEDMGYIFKSGMSLDRVNNNKGYSKENCRWATQKEQVKNRSNTVLLNYKGEVKTLKEWADKTGIPYETLRHRKLSGWSIKRLIETPLLSRKETGMLSVKSPNHINNKRHEKRNGYHDKKITN